MSAPRRLSLVFVFALLFGANGEAFAQSENSETKANPESDPKPTVLVVVGAEGAEEYGEKFLAAAASWGKASEVAEANFKSIGVDSTTTDNHRDLLEETLKELTAEKNAGPLWLVLIGHGTFDGRVAKFNVRGPDFTDLELAEWLKDFDRPLAVINTSSASGPFLSSLAGKDRVVITATKSAFEVFYARFGEYFAEAIAGLEDADVDNDDQVSLLEAFLYSADQVAQFYEMQGRLATEHALIDDTGDGMGTRPDWFEGVRATRVAKSGADPDGELAHQWVLVPNAFERQLSAEQKSKRDDLERKLRNLVRRRQELGEEAYYAQVEPILVEIAKIYDSVELPSEPKKAEKARADSEKEAEEKPDSDAQSS